MDSIPSKLHAFPNQHLAKIFPNTTIQLREVKIIDQFSDSVKTLISKYFISDSICGYIAPCVGIYIAQKLKNSSFQKSIDILIENLNEQEILFNLVEGVIQFIQKDRTEYINKNSNLFLSEIEKQFYLKDWVANYEISDYLKTNPLKNLFFFRFCGLDFPTEAAECKHEEAKRLIEEEPFKGQTYFIESFYPEQKLQSINDWKKNYKDFLQNNDEGIVFVTDLKGHFVVFFAFFLLLNNKKIPFVILIDSTKNTYMNSAVTAEICNLINFN